MKKPFQVLITAMSTCLLSCNTASTEKTGTDSAASVATNEQKMEYAYTIDHPDNWEIGDQKNTAVALKSLKAFENGDIPAAMEGFGDTVRIEFDQMEATLSNDSLKSMFTKVRSEMKDLKIKMEDWESVISKDKKTEYVSLWYKQIWTDEKGKTDSVECMDDVKMKDGKIVLLNEKTRRYAVKK